MHRTKIDLPSGPATVLSLTKEEFTELCKTLADAMPLPPEAPKDAREQIATALVSKNLLPLQKTQLEGAPSPVCDIWMNYEIHTEVALFCLEGYESLVQEFAHMDLATTIGGEALAEGKKSRIMFFSDVFWDFQPNLNKANKNFITRVQIFLVEEKGYYGQVYVTTCKKVGGFFEVLENVHPVKIDLETKQFVTIEKDHGEKRGFRFQDRLKCENIEKMIEFVIEKIVSEPDAVLTPVEGMDGEIPDVDDADFWKDKHDDPDWWRKGPGQDPNAPQAPNGLF
jgi:hypothetical protein